LASKRAGVVTLGVGDIHDLAAAVAVAAATILARGLVLSPTDGWDSWTIGVFILRSVRNRQGFGRHNASDGCRIR
jgi:uncharacterized membrane protein